MYVRRKDNFELRNEYKMSYTYEKERNYYT